MSVILAVFHIKVGLYCTNCAFLLELTLNYFFNMKKKIKNKKLLGPQNEIHIYEYKEPLPGVDAALTYSFVAELPILAVPLHLYEEGILHLTPIMSNWSNMFINPYV